MVHSVAAGSSGLPVIRSRAFPPVARPASHPVTSEPRRSSLSVSAGSIDPASSALIIARASDTRRSGHPLRNSVIREMLVVSFDLCRGWRSIGRNGPGRWYWQQPGPRVSLGRVAGHLRQEARVYHDFMLGAAARFHVIHDCEHRPPAAPSMPSGRARGSGRHVGQPERESEQHVLVGPALLRRRPANAGRVTAAGTRTRHVERHRRGWAPDERSCHWPWVAGSETHDAAVRVRHNDGALESGSHECDHPASRSSASRTAR